LRLSLSPNNAKDQTNGFFGKVVGDEMVLRIPMNAKPEKSASGKTLVVVSTYGNKENPRSFGMICSASSFFPCGIGCLPWLAPPLDSLSRSGAIEGVADQFGCSKELRGWETTISLPTPLP